MRLPSCHPHAPVLVVPPNVEVGVSVHDPRCRRQVSRHELQQRRLACVGGAGSEGEGVRWTKGGRGGSKSSLPSPVMSFSSVDLPVGRRDTGEGQKQGSK